MYRSSSNYSSYAKLSKSPEQEQVPKISESKNLITIKSIDHRNAVFKDDIKKLTIIDNYTSWCGPCKNLAPKFSALADKFGHLVNFCKEDAEAGIPGGKPVTGVPCIHFYFKGQFMEELTVHGADITAIYDNMMKFMVPVNTNKDKSSDKNLVENEKRKETENKIKKVDKNEKDESVEDD